MEIAADVAEELHANGVLEAVAALPPSHQAEYISWIESAKKPETRASRIVKTCEMVAEKSTGH